MAGSVEERPEQRPVTFRFRAQAWLFLWSAFAFGLAQAQQALFLNFYLEALGLGASWQGVVNALPALALVVASIPAAAIARRIGYARALQFGAGISTLGLGMLASAGGPALALAGTLVQGFGTAFMAVAGAPFLAGHSDARTRVSLFSVQMIFLTFAGFLGNLLGGQVPALYANVTGTEVQGLESIRAALIAGGAFQLVGFIPLFFLRSPPVTKAATGSILKIKNKGLMFRLVLPNLLVGLGAGATIPFLNIFIEGKFEVSYASLGTLFAWTSLATALANFVQPWIVRRFGRLRAILIVQGASLPFLAVLGFAPSLALVTAALFTRGALMNAAGPVYTAYAMDELPEEDRGMYSAVNIIGWDIGWAASSLASGFVRSALGFEAAFNVLFINTIVMYSLSVVAIYVLLYRRASPEQRRV